MSESPTVRWLRWGQHALLAGLAIVCATRAVGTGTHPAAELAGLTVFVGWYLLGLPLTRRGMSGAVWFVLLALVWGGLVLISPENVWLAFPLWLLAGHLLPLTSGVVVSVAILAVVLLEPVRQGGETTFAAVIGPLIGMVVALGISRAQIALVREGIERQRLIASLYAAQAESAALTDELARVQRAAGASSERTRLSRDIHDGIAQSFSSILLLARAARTEQDAARLPELLESLEGSAAEGLEESRRVVAALAPADLDEGGLVAALHRVTERFTAESGVDASVVVEGAGGAEGTVPPLATTAEVAVLRSVQGALANVRAHARATEVTIEVLVGAESLTIAVTDDGRGFNAADWASRAPDATGGYGLRATRARLRELRGDLEVTSTPGEGTTVTVTLPFAPSAGDRP